MRRYFRACRGRCAVRTPASDLSEIRAGTLETGDRGRFPSFPSVRSLNPCPATALPCVPRPKKGVREPFFPPRREKKGLPDPFSFRRDPPTDRGPVNAAWALSVAPGARYCRG